MDAKNVAIARTEFSELLEDYSRAYLGQYWPEFPQSAVGWADNAVLMLAYQEAALAVRTFFGGKSGSMLDISTGPALAPLLAMISCVSEVQLSDFNASNRYCLEHMPVDYWRNYVPMLTKLFGHPESITSELLLRLDKLRSAHKPVCVDLFSEPSFPSEITPADYEIISMQFVADGITASEPEYLRCLGRVTDMVRPGAALIMSAVVDADVWQLGDFDMPAAKVSETTILDFLSSQGFKILNMSRLMRFPGLTYSGGWIVFAAAKMPG